MTFVTVATASAAHAAHYYVYTTNSTNPQGTINSGDNYCNIAEAVKAINDNAPVTNCVDQDAGNPGQITLIQAQNRPYASYPYKLGNNAITINRNIRIQPSEEGFVAHIESTGALAFKVNSGKEAIFYGVNIRHTGTGSGRVLWNAGTTYLSNATIRNGNVTTEALGKGGGIYNQGTLTLSSTSVLNNSAKRGGGIYNDDGQIPYLNGTVSGNTATMAGGGIYNMATTTVNGWPKGDIGLNAVITANTAKSGGGIFNRGEVHIEGDTSITSNVATGTGSGETCHAGSCDGYGGGVVTLNTGNIIAGFRTYAPSLIQLNKATNFGGAFYSTGQLNLSAITISSNEAKSGAAIYAAALVVNGVVMSNYCEVTASHGTSSITFNKTVPAGGYSIVDSSGAFGTYCLFIASALNNTSPRCNPAGVRPGTSCPQ